MPHTAARVLHPSRTEVIGAVASGAVAIGGAIALPVLAAAQPGEGIPITSPADAEWWIVVCVVVVQAVVLLWARRFPRAVVSAVALISLVDAIVVPGGTYSLTTVAVSFAVFWAVLLEPLRRLRLLLPLVAVLVAVCELIDGARSGTELDAVTVIMAVLQAVAVVGIPLVIALFFAARADARTSRGNELLALEREHDALVQAAVSRERIAMSRELHDIAAHHVSGIALLASAIQRQVDLDPEAAKVSARQVRAQSTAVLDDLRRVVGLLRDESEATRSVETLAAVRELVELRRTAGVEIDLVQLLGDHELGAGIGPLAQLVAYRMVQESLANAAVHAPEAKCVVELDDREPDRLTVRVVNEASRAPDLGPGSGFGLVGMRERADLVDGDLHYGVTEAGGWGVRLILRRDGMIDNVNGTDA